MIRSILTPLALTVALAQGGCTLGLMQKDYVSRAETIPVTAAPAGVGTLPVQAITPEDASSAEARSIATLLLPESAGRILRVREKHFSNGSRQEILIATDKGTFGENVIDVHIRTVEPGPRHNNPMMIGPPSESGMRSEILSRFPDVQMNIVTRPMRNALGPFGLAIGRHSAGSRCIFAWQWIDDLREAKPGTSNIVKMNALMAGRAMAASIRIRLCRSDSTVDQLASHIEGLRVGSAEALERLTKLDRRDIDGEPVAVNGTRSTPLVKPVGQSLEAAIARPVRREAAPAQVARANPRPQRQPPRRVARRDPPPQAAPQPAPQPAPMAAPVYAPPPPQQGVPAGHGQRYLAPVAGMPAPPAYGGAAPGAAAPAGGISLPPQAYRGPGH